MPTSGRITRSFADGRIGRVDQELDDVGIEPGVGHDRTGGSHEDRERQDGLWVGFHDHGVAGGK
jgi:hypothetical protein